MSDLRGAQLSLFVERRLEGQFLTFHAEHPEVYSELVRLARVAISKGLKRYGIGALWELMRWHFRVDRANEEFKLNNNHRSRYARLIMEREPDLIGFFETRELRS